MRPEVHIAVLKALEKTKPELSEDTTFPVSEVVTFDVNGTVQTGKSTTVTPTFKPPVVDQVDVLDELERAMKKMIRLGSKVKEQYAPQIALVRDRIERVQVVFQSKTESKPRRGSTTVAVELKEL